MLLKVVDVEATVCWPLVGESWRLCWLLLKGLGMLARLGGSSDGGRGFGTPRQHPSFERGADCPGTCFCFPGNKNTSHSRESRLGYR